LPTERSCHFFSPVLEVEAQQCGVVRAVQVVPDAADPAVVVGQVAVDVDLLAPPGALSGFSRSRAAAAATTAGVGG
jgi:hypothetical protein